MEGDVPKEFLLLQPSDKSLKPVKLKFPSPALAFRNHLVLSLGISVASISQQASAVSSTWDAGAGTQDWNTAANWSGDTFPTGNWPDGIATINTGTGLFPIISANPAFTPSDILVADGGTNTGRLDHTAGTAATGNGNWMVVGRGGSSAGTYNLANTAGTGGTLTGFAQGTGSMTVGGGTNNGRLILADGGTASGTLNMNTSGTLYANEGLGLLVGTNGGTGTINLDGGTIDTSQAWFGDNSSSGSGNLNMSGGTITATGNFIVGRNGGTGALNMTGGSINGGGEIWFGEQIAANTGGGTGTISGAGAINAGSWLVIGRSGTDVSSSLTLNGNASISARNNGGFGNLEIAVFDSVGGTLNINGNSTVRLLSNADMILGAGNTTGTGTVNQNGGTVTFYSDAGTTAGGTGVLKIGAGPGFNDMSYYLNGGVLNVNEVTRTGANNFARFHFNGGTLRANQSSATFFHNLVEANVRNGGAIIDSNGFNITVDQVLRHSSNIADNAIDGGLTKNGSGNLTIVSASTYTGNTTVTAGTLSLGANSATTFADTSTVSIATGAVLDLPNAGADTVAGLVLGGVAKPAGTYNSATPGGFITGGGSIQVVAGSTYATYASSHGLSAVPTEDTDADGVKNGVEYFMNAATGFTANPGIVSNKVTWPKDPAFSGTYTVQTSPDLSTWSNVSSTVVGNTVVYTVPADQGKFFIRLDVITN